jgi:hypothetical protein
VAAVVIHAEVQPIPVALPGTFAERMQKAARLGTTASSDDRTSHKLDVDEIHAQSRRACKWQQWQWRH